MGHVFTKIVEDPDDNLMDRLLVQCSYQGLRLTQKLIDQAQWPMTENFSAKCMSLYDRKMNQAALHLCSDTLSF